MPSAHVLSTNNNVNGIAEISYTFYNQAHEAVLKQIQEDREQQKLRRQGHTAAASSHTTSSPLSTSSATEDKPSPEKKIDDTALLQVWIIPLQIQPVFKGVDNR